MNVTPRRFKKKKKSATGQEWELKGRSTKQKETFKAVAKISKGTKWGVAAYSWSFMAFMALVASSSEA
jgi:hypothetical protein